uniref:EOG090X0H1B n=1 Tax=Daphnia lumholtzi TaxID=42856 RepID=A0A4Y7MD28_9CRUS|nr:EOG090X0H1B [Daphnia lumholtzi]SVE77955.1 EOG090X0H1B [Daphnia lumholtzi]SVE78584.1 EOG090X0H1B [Daphnia lumholtzi]
MLKSKNQIHPPIPKAQQIGSQNFTFTVYNKRKRSTRVSLTIFYSPRALELFVESLLTKAVQITSARNAKTLSPAHLKQCILAESRFDFLKDLVLTIPDVQTEGEDNGITSVPSTPTAQQTQPLVFRSLSEAGKWAGRKSDSEETDSGDSEDDDDEENSSDTESLPKGPSSSKNGRDIALATAHQAAFQFNAVQPNFYQEIGGQNNSSYQIQINLPPETAPCESDKIGNGQEKEVAPATAHHANNDDDDYDT